MTAVGGARHRRNQDRQQLARSGKHDNVGQRDDRYEVGEPNEEEAGSSSGSQHSEEGGDEQGSDDGEDDLDDDDVDEDGDDDDDDDDDEEEDGAGDGEDDEDESPFRFLESLDPNWLTRKSSTTSSDAETSSNQAGSHNRSPAAGADDAEFYGAMIQMLTHVLGSSDSIAWPNQPTPGSLLATSPFGNAYSSPAQTPNHAAGSLSAPLRSTVRSSNQSSKSELSALQPLIQALIARLGKDHQLPRRPVGEQDLTALLQTLMEQQQRQQERHSPKQGVQNQAVGAYPASNYPFTQQDALAQAPSSRSSQPVDYGKGGYSLSAPNTAYQTLNFADLDFEDEDEDDPDFNPDLNPDLPLPSAWSLAVRDVVASEESRAAAAAAAVAASHSGTTSGAQTPANGLGHGTNRSGNPLASAHSPSHVSSEGLATRRTSFEERAAPSYRRDSLAQPTTSTHADAPEVTRFSATDLLFSPSGRPIRTSRKRQASPTPMYMSSSFRASDHAPTPEVVVLQISGQSDGIQSLQRPAPNIVRQELPTTSASETLFEVMSSSAPPGQAEAEPSAPRKRGRKPVLEPGEAQRRRAQRNIEYQRMRRQVKKAEESEQSETVLELKAEVKMLRAEMERLRDENAMLRAQRELDRLQRSNRG